MAVVAAYDSGKRMQSYRRSSAFYFDDVMFLYNQAWFL